MKDFSKFKLPLFLLTDVIFISLAIYLSFLLRFDASIPPEKATIIFPAIMLAVLTTIPTFLIQNLYKISWAYVSLTDIPKIIKSIIISTALFVAGLFILRTYPFYGSFPRSIIFFYAILLFIFVTVFRFSKRFYWQLLKGRVPSEREWNSVISKAKPQDKKINTVLITGGAGYIGSILSRKLLKKDYRVKVIDKLLFGDDSIKKLYRNPNFQFIKGDIQKAEDIDRAIEDADAVVHLAAIVGDPACAAQQDTAIKTNYLSTVNLARACKYNNINKFLFASTCSVYGAGDSQQLTEGSKLNPVSIYAESKIYAEKELVKLTDENFMPIIFRFATIYGLSSRMRFDLVINLLTMKAFTEKEILIFGGNQWRPFIHVKDVARGLVKCLETPFAKMNGQIFNLGSGEENYQISDLGNLIKKIMPETKVDEIQKDKDDQRTYNVCFDKAKQVFDFSPSKTVKDGIQEIYDMFQKGKFINPKDSKYYNYVTN